MNPKKNKRSNDKMLKMCGCSAEGSEIELWCEDKQSRTLMRNSMPQKRWLGKKRFSTKV